VLLWEDGIPATPHTGLQGTETAFQDCRLSQGPSTGVLQARHAPRQLASSPSTTRPQLSSYRVQLCALNNTRHMAELPSLSLLNDKTMLLKPV
jgi:hypothetical protein